MDYEKKYNEAMERAKKMTSDLTNLQAIREFIFPELRESEDERIRKKLIKTIGYFRSRGIDQQLCEEFRAYLEKQEQKPVEWSDKDRNTFNLALDLIKHSDDCDGLLDKDLAVKWFAELPSRFVPQPKQEWSDGTKQWFDAIIKDYEDLLSGDEDHDPAIQIKINLLKSLRPQPKVDSVEYERGFLAGQGSIQHWKPSEEQMEAFEESLMSVAYTENKIILESLLEQLKKLCQ